MPNEPDQPRPIAAVAAGLGIPESALIPYGRDKAKVETAAVPAGTGTGKLVLVTAMTPTVAGEGKTTLAIGLADALAAAGVRTALALREPSLGPVFGQKGGGAGGGRAQLVPADDINLHFTGDLHAIGAANNLLAAMVDNHLYWGNALGLDPTRIAWRRAIDMNDRSLRRVELRGDTVPRETGFDIVAASEAMAVLALARDLGDLRRRLARIVVGWDRGGQPVTAEALKADGAMAALLRDAAKPNLVQTLAGTPAFVHCGPFANIAHGCSSVMASHFALGHADCVVTEAGFGADLGAEKFCNIAGRQSGLRPHLAVLIATLRALKWHGGVTKESLERPDASAIDRGFANLARHAANLKALGLPVLIAINRFISDSDDEIAQVRQSCERLGVAAVAADPYGGGGSGCGNLAAAVRTALTTPAPELRFTYPDDAPLADKLDAVARSLYGASGVALSEAARTQLEVFTAAGFGRLPMCIAKTQYSFTTDAKVRGAPAGHVLPVREARLSAGAGFVVAVCGEIMTMPGLARRPAAEQISLDPDGRIRGLH